MVDVHDNATVAAPTESGHEGKIYERSGPQALTHVEVAEGLSKALGRQVAFIDILPEAMRDAFLGSGGARRDRKSSATIMMNLYATTLPCFPEVCRRWPRQTR
jgi:uncharacterized protein YbjT (DUF2867 family)